MENKKSISEIFTESCESKNFVLYRLWYFPFLPQNGTRISIAVFYNTHLKIFLDHCSRGVLFLRNSRRRVLSVRRKMRLYRRTLFRPYLRAGRKSLEMMLFFYYRTYELIKARCRTRRLRHLGRRQSQALSVESGCFAWLTIPRRSGYKRIVSREFFRPRSDLCYTEAARRITRQL